MRLWLVGGIVLALVASITILPGFATSASKGPAAVAAVETPPDLGMDIAYALQIQTTADGKRVLRYSAVIANVGAGRFETRGVRKTTSEPEMTVNQRIYDDAGVYRKINTPAKMFFGGDGHNHWHIRDLEGATLTNSGGAVVGTPAKHGFCVYDNKAYRLTLPGAPATPVYRGCGGPTNLEVKMGISIGWGDKYGWSLPDQYIDITGLPAGSYRLTLTADPSNWFFESNDSNNSSWVDLQLDGGTGVTVTGSGGKI